MKSTKYIGGPGMTSRERVKCILNRKTADRTGFWMGAPVERTLEIYCQYFNVTSHEELSTKLESDLFWVPAEFDAYHHPEGRPMFDVLGGKERKSVCDPGVFAECADIAEVESFYWPDAKYLDFNEAIRQMDRIHTNNQAVFGGPWSCIFQFTVDFFGMENLFIKMYTEPAVVEAVIEHIVSFYLAANKKFFDIAADRLDAFFFANDLGGQEDLLISPELIKRFFIPGFKKIIEQAKSYGLKVIMHSCGAVSKAIPMLIEAGIDGLHPLQTKAKGMDAETLSREFGRDLIFIGGIDTQELLTKGTDIEIYNEVKRLREVFGMGFIVSPSHEGVLPDISPQNMLALKRAATFFKNE
jgi:Uroporphyrinogen-III decarboxylase